MDVRKPSLRAVARGGEDLDRLRLKEGPGRVDAVDADVEDGPAAAVEAARLRLRPILMTSLAFILGVLPLATAVGPGAEMRRNLGTAVSSGMLGVTVMGVFLTPLFYVILRRKFTARPHEES